MLFVVAQLQCLSAEPAIGIQFLVIVFIFLGFFIFHICSDLGSYKELCSYQTHLSIRMFQLKSKSLLIFVVTVSCQ
jgi:hypothetical protein